MNIVCYDISVFPLPIRIHFNITGRFLILGVIFSKGWISIITQSYSICRSMQYTKNENSILIENEQKEKKWKVK